MTIQCKMTWLIAADILTDSKLTESVRYQAEWHNHALRARYGDTVTRYSIRLNKTKRYSEILPI